MASVLDNTVEDLKPQKKEIEILKVLAEKVRGHVKWYSVARRYGFISRNDDGGDLFVHRSVISSCARRIPSLRSGEEVEFNVVETNHGVEANYVTGPGGQPVKPLDIVWRIRVIETTCQYPPHR
ncbi:cold-shock DNA-binding domain protein [Opisthorchis viverrini]|uniref:Cold-shock DNA-binding domain protein n=1 Tax=Opisthorchis viverrini TaxID=6198 RepID=A0A1S8X8N3_OPIVI|nr:cold-shock DNA-binding domain protein [Opisthorchis viverrini]